MTGAPAIDALGDVHGDVAATARILSAAGLITTSTPFHWTGGNRILVVTGDVIDKGTAALPIIDLLITLESEASAAGGRVVVTLGNHEAEFLADPTDSKSDVFQAELQSRNLDPKKVAAGDTTYGAWLLTRPVAALIDGWFFSHAGNSGGMSAAVIARTFEQLVDAPVSNGGRSRFDDPFLIGPSSLLEQQVWWKTTGTTPTTVIDVNLAALPAQHIVFGHDPGAITFPDDPQGDRARGQMAFRYDGRLGLIDVGMSSAVGYSPGALLRIARGASDQATALFANGTSEVLWP
ncbi:MAG: metallophosphoesterase [Deltaproteobacteria bacterium]|nr:metallophosphoesterase [Deltaproteobacteria bacterium]